VQSSATYMICWRNKHALRNVARPLNCQCKMDRCCSMRHTWSRAHVPRGFAGPLDAMRAISNRKGIWSRSAGHGRRTVSYRTEKMARHGMKVRTTIAEHVLDPPEASLLDVLDHVLNKGVMATGDVTLGVAGVDLIYVRLSAILCAADRVLPRRPQKPARPRQRRTLLGR
jgi:hypothetical protein